MLTNLTNFLVTWNSHDMSILTIMSNNLTDVYDKWIVCFDFFFFFLMTWMPNSMSIVARMSNISIDVGAKFCVNCD